MRFGKVTVQHANGELRDLDGRTLPNGNVTVSWPLHGEFTFSGRDGRCLDQGMRSWRLADLRAIP